MTQPIDLDALSAQLIVSALERIETKVDSGISDVVAIKVQVASLAKRTDDHMANLSTTNKDLAALRTDHNNLQGKIQRYSAIFLLVFTGAWEVGRELVVRLVTGNHPA